MFRFVTSFRFSQFFCHKHNSAQQGCGGRGESGAAGERVIVDGANVSGTRSGTNRKKTLVWSCRRRENRSQKLSNLQTQIAGFRGEPSKNKSSEHDE